MNERLNDRGLQKWQGMIFPEQKALFNEKATYLRKKEWTKQDEFVLQLYPKI